MNIIFICMGNTCRSPLAEAILKDKLRKDGHTDINVSSMGFMLGGSHASKHSKDIAMEHGIDISNHISRKIESEELKKADLIFTMEEHMVENILYSIPNIKHKTFALGQWNYSTLELCSSHGIDISDPCGGSKEKYSATYDIIEKEINRILPYLF